MLRLYKSMYIFRFPLCTHIMCHPLVRVTENMVIFFPKSRASQPISGLEIAVIFSPSFLCIRNTATRLFFDPVYNLPVSGEEKKKKKKNTSR